MVLCGNLLCKNGEKVMKLNFCTITLSQEVIRLRVLSCAAAWRCFPLSLPYLHIKKNNIARQHSDVDYLSQHSSVSTDIPSALGKFLVFAKCQKTVFFVSLSNPLYSSSVRADNVLTLRS